MRWPSAATVRSVVSAGEDGKVILWDLATGRQLHAFEGHRVPVRSLAFNQDGIACWQAAPWTEA